LRRVAIKNLELAILQPDIPDQHIRIIGGIQFRLEDDTARITAVDHGPGIENVEKALTEGFSTANDWIRSLGFGAGMGLPNVKRVSDSFDIESRPGTGTTVTSLIYTNPPQKEGE